MAHTILRLPAVRARTGLSKTTIYFQVSEGVFPAPVLLGQRAVGWIEAEIADWISARAKTRRRNTLAEERRPTGKGRA